MVEVLKHDYPLLISLKSCSETPTSQIKVSQSLFMINSLPETDTKGKIFGEAPGEPTPKQRCSETDAFISGIRLSPRPGFYLAQSVSISIYHITVCESERDIYPNFFL